MLHSQLASPSRVGLCAGTLKELPFGTSSESTPMILQVDAGDKLFGYTRLGFTMMAAKGQSEGRGMPAWVVIQGDVRTQARPNSREELSTEVVYSEWPHLFCKLSNSGRSLSHGQPAEDQAARRPGLLGAATQVVMQDHRIPSRQLLVTYVPHPDTVFPDSLESLEDDLAYVRAHLQVMFDHMPLTQAMLERYKHLHGRAEGDAVAPMAETIDDLRERIRSTVVFVPPSELDRVTEHIQQNPEQPYTPLNQVREIALTPSQLVVFNVPGLLDSSSSGPEETSEGSDSDEDHTDGAEEHDPEEAPGA